MFIDVRLRPEVTGDKFERALARLLPVVEALHVTGTFDYLLRVEVRDARSLDDLIRRGPGSFIPTTATPCACSIRQTVTRLVVMLSCGERASSRRPWAGP